MLRNLSKLSSKTQENASRRLLTLTWYYKTMLSKSTINLTSNSNNKFLGASITIEDREAVH